MCLFVCLFVLRWLAACAGAHGHARTATRGDARGYAGGDRERGRLAQRQRGEEREGDGEGRARSRRGARASGTRIRGFVVSANLRDTCWSFYSGKIAFSANLRKTSTRNVQKIV